MDINRLRGGLGMRESCVWVLRSSGLKFGLECCVGSLGVGRESVEGKYGESSVRSWWGEREKG